MAKKYGIEYVNYYTEGSAARKIMPALRSVKAMLPKPKKHKRRVIYLDPVAVLGMAVAVCMLLMMFVGLVQLNEARQKTMAMEQYVQKLDDQKELLSEQYHTGYDIEEVEHTALALGMVPKSRVQQTTIHMPMLETDTVESVTLWDRIGTFLSSLFA